MVYVLPTVMGIPLRPLMNGLRLHLFFVCLDCRGVWVDPGVRTASSRAAGLVPGRKSG